MFDNLLFFLLILYSGLIAYLLMIAIVFPRKKMIAGTVTENVSIIIPCKNEAQNLPGLFTSLLQQIFNAKIEIVIVDDGSIDTTKELVHHYQQQSLLNIKYIFNNFVPVCGLTSKQQAIDTGINEASHDVIVLTDADMIFDPTWLQSFFTTFNDTTDLMFGHTAVKLTSHFFSFFQAFQLEFLFSIAAVFYFAGIKGSCMGNNLMLRKKAYLECGGQKAIGYSITEDRALLYHFYKCRRKIEITTPFYPKAFTWPHVKVSLFINQLLRWAKGGFGNGHNLLLFATLFSLQNITLILSFFGCINSNCMVLTLLNFILTWIMVGIVFTKNHSLVSPLFFPLYFFFFIAETIVFPILLVAKKKVTWKDTAI
jgi:glycosyltransferase involved in cell wall biosynthesis